MKSITRPGGDTHVVIEHKDLEEFYGKERAITDMVRKNAPKRVIEKGVSQFFVTFSENFAPEWMMLSAVIKEAQKHWDLPQKSKRVPKNKPAENIVREEAKVEVVSMQGCSANLRQYLGSYNGNTDLLGAHYQDDKSAFDALWPHIKVYDDALYGLIFIQRKSHRILLAMRAVVLAKTALDIQSAKEMLPLEYREISTERIEKLMTQVK